MVWLKFKFFTYGLKFNILLTLDLTEIYVTYLGFEFS